MIRDSRSPCNLELNLNHGRELKIVRPQYSITRRRVYIALCLEFPGFDFNRARGGEKKRKKGKKNGERKSVVDRPRGENETKTETTTKTKTELPTTCRRGSFSIFGLIDPTVLAVFHASDNTRENERGSTKGDRSSGRGGTTIRQVTGLATVVKRSMVVISLRRQEKAANVRVHVEGGGALSHRGRLLSGNARPLR